MAAINLNIELISNYFKTKPVSKVWLFGSFARGEETSSSDVDLLVLFDEKTTVSLMTRAAMTIELEELLKRPVDLVREGTLYPQIIPFVDADKILIYERAG